MNAPIYRFGSFEISPDEKLLRRDGQPVSLPPKAVETLLLLIKSPGEVVSKEEILQVVWPDVVVEENNLTQQISILRKALGNGEASWIQTVPKRGYRFAGQVTAAEKSRPIPAHRENEEQASIPRARYWRRLPASLGAIVVLIALVVVFASFARRPEEIRSVAVLPIQPLVASDELSAVGLGVSDAVVQRLSYARAFDVRPISSVRKYLGRSVDPVAVGKELQVDAVIAGTIQRSDDHYRVTMELVDVRTNRARWSGKIDEKATDLFRLQDVVAEAMMRSLSAEAKAHPPRKPAIPEAHEAFLKGRYYWSRRTGDDVERAVAEFERAVAIDDSYAAACGRVWPAHSICKAFTSSMNHEPRSHDRVPRHGRPFSWTRNWPRRMRLWALSVSITTGIGPRGRRLSGEPSRWTPTTAIIGSSSRIF